VIIRPLRLPVLVSVGLDCSAMAFSRDAAWKRAEGRVGSVSQVPREICASSD
jgi:hypothetical protein